MSLPAQSENKPNTILLVQTSLPKMEMFINNK